MVSDRLKDYLNNHPKSLRQIAKESGVSITSLSLFLNDKRTMNSDNLDKLADYFNLQLVPKDN